MMPTRAFLLTRLIYTIVVSSLQEIGSSKVETKLNTKLLGGIIIPVYRLQFYSFSYHFNILVVTLNDIQFSIFPMFNDYFLVLLYAS